MVNVLINVQHVNKNLGGVYQYTYALLTTLEQNTDERVNFIIFSDNTDKELLKQFTEFSKFKILSEKLPFKYFILNQLIKLKNVFIRRINKIDNELFDVFDHIIKKYKIDIVHTPYPKNINNKKVYKIATIHDIQELHFPEFFSSYERANRAVTFKSAIDNSDLIIVSYNHIKNDIIKYFNKDPNKIYVILLGMQSLWFKHFTDSENLKSISSQKSNLPEKYILYPAATWEHKNHKNLLKALYYLIYERGVSLNLICTGNKTDHFYNEIKEVIDDLGLANYVQFLGIVDDFTLYTLYQNTLGVVIPTLYEAGSFPLMESMLMGIPVICSNVTSLPETIGNKDYIFDPYNLNDMVAKIQMLVENEQFRKDNISNSIKERDKLINNKSFKEIINIYLQSL